MTDDKIDADQSRITRARELLGLSVAVTVAVCHITENDTKVTRGIEMILLVKTEERWQIVSQAWDTEGVTKPIPTELLNSD